MRVDINHPSILITYLKRFRPDRKIATGYRRTVKNSAVISCGEKRRRSNQQSTIKGNKMDLKEFLLEPSAVFSRSNCAWIIEVVIQAIRMEENFPYPVNGAFALYEQRVDAGCHEPQPLVSFGFSNSPEQVPSDHTWGQSRLTIEKVMNAINEAACIPGIIRGLYKAENGLIVYIVPINETHRCLFTAKAAHLDDDAPPSVTPILDEVKATCFEQQI
jgi:hypothetical protein